jgi:uncharacterized membrane protein
MSTAEGVRRAKTAMLVVLTLILLGLAPVVLVQDRVAYFAAWSAFLLIYLTASLSAIATLRGQITRRNARMIRYVVSVVTMTVLGVSLWISRS